MAGTGCARVRGRARSHRDRVIFWNMGKHLLPLRHVFEFEQGNGFHWGAALFWSFCWAVAFTGRAQVFSAVLVAFG